MAFPYEQQRMAQDRNRLPSSAGATAPGGARRAVDRNALTAAMGILGPTQPQQVQGNPSASMPGQAPQQAPQNPGIATANTGPAGVVGGAQSATPQVGGVIGQGLVDIRGQRGFTMPGTGVVAPWDVEDLGPLEYLDGLNPRGGDDAGPTNIDDLSLGAQGGLYELLNELLGRGGRDVEAEQQALRDQMTMEMQRGIVDDRARFGAMGGGASGALAAVEMDALQRGALERELASQDLAQQARAEDLAAFGQLVGGFGSLENTAANARELDLLFQLLAEGDGGADDGGLWETVTGNMERGADALGRARAPDPGEVFDDFLRFLASGGRNRITVPGGGDNDPRRDEDEALPIELEDGTFA